MHAEQRRRLGDAEQGVGLGVRHRSNPSPDRRPRSIGSNGAFGRSSASDARYGMSREHSLDGPVGPRTVRRDGPARQATRTSSTRADAADRHEENPDPEADDAGRRGPPASPAEQAHRVGQGQVRDEVATLRRLQSHACRGVLDRPRQHEQAIGDIDRARSGARIGRGSVALGQPGNGRGVRLLQQIGTAAPDLRDGDQRLCGACRIQGKRPVVVPQVERPGLAGSLNAPPGAVDPDLHVAVERDEPLAVARHERIAAADPAGHPHRAHRLRPAVEQAADRDLGRPGQPPGESRVGRGRAEHEPGCRRDDAADDDERGEADAERHVRRCGLPPARPPARRWPAPGRGARSGRPRRAARPLPTPCRGRGDRGRPAR